MDSPLREWMKAKKISQADLAGYAGCAAGIVSMVCNGEIPLRGELRKCLERIAPVLVPDIDHYHELHTEDVKQRLEAA